MAYTVRLDNAQASKNAQGIYTVSFTATVNDGSSDIFSSDISGKYNPNAPDLEATKDQIRQHFQTQWDKFADEAGLLSSAALEAARSALETQANSYVNT